jgi:hypothetical protein
MLFNLSKTCDVYDFSEPSIIYNCYKSINIDADLLKIKTTSLKKKNNHFVIYCYNRYKIPIYSIKISNNKDYKNFLIILNSYQKHIYTKNIIMSQSDF